jgi:hypothetical protein
MITACTSVPVNKQYSKAVKEAAFVKASESANTLLAIKPNNANLVWNEDKTKVLVVTWKSRDAYDKFIKNNTNTSNDPNYALWVSAVPQVKSFCQTYERHNDDDLNLRIKQYLGLAPDWQYDVFVELWVSPDSLFRPCVDPNIDDTQCDIKVPQQFPSVKNIPDYGYFYKNLYFKSFRESAGVPWTGLGYTYDWGNKESEVGASEFIVTPHAPYEIKQVLSTHEYCAK